MSDRSAPRFPTPQELAERQTAAVSDEAAQLGELINDKMAKHNFANGPCSVLVQDYSSAAIQTVMAELEAAGWSVELASDHNVPDLWIRRK